MESISKLTETVLENTKRFIDERIDLSDKALTVAAAYVMSTYLVKNFDQLYYLRILGSTGTGKTTFAKTLGRICFNPYIRTGLETPAGFLTMLNTGVTMIADDLSKKALLESPTFGAVLRNGSWKFGHVMMNVGGSDVKMKSFSSFGAKIIVANKRFTDPALESRFVTIKMRRKLFLNVVDVPVFNPENKLDDAKLALNNWHETLQTPKGKKYMGGFRDHRDFLEKLCGFSFEKREVK